MKIAIVKASDLGDRMDAGFHVALAEVRDRVRELEALYPGPEGHREIRRRLGELAFTDKGALAVLARGNLARFNEKAATRVIRDYPYLSFALVEKALDAAVQRIRERIAGDEKYLRALLDLAGKPLS